MMAQIYVMIRMVGKLAIVFLLAAAVSLLTGVSAFVVPSSAVAQEAGDGPPESGFLQPETEGQRLGNIPNDQIRQFQMRRACEQDLPECLPAVRAIIEEERRNRMWMAIGIVAILVLVALLAIRESDKKKKKVDAEMRQHRKLGQRLKSKWRGAVKDPYKDHDPLGDE
ncbi:MAG: hypothetical protein RIF37_14490 [Rhodospirillaceae bacterium]|jgi:hypothetical protein